MKELRSERLSVRIAPPGSTYRQERFDWSSFITSIQLDGQHEFLGKESSGDEIGCGGEGLSGEFCMVSPLNYEDAQVGETFLKIGIGELIKNSTDPYVFYFPYTFKPVKWQEDWQHNQVIFACMQPEVNGYAYEFRKKISVCGTTLTTDYTLKNTGKRKIETEEYVHNFLLINHDPIGANYQLSVDFACPFDPHETPFEQDGFNYHFSKPVKKEFCREKVFRFQGENFTWTLNHLGSGVSMSETLSAPMMKFTIFGKPQVLSPEMFAHVCVAPGETFTWQRQWTFGNHIQQ